MRIRLIIYLSLLVFCLPVVGKAESFARQSSYTVCFTPGQNCTAEIVDVINNAVSDIWVQAYSFTSRPIAKALVVAQQRGVKVQIILDKSALIGTKGALLFFMRHKIPVWIDNQPAIAHNKVMIIDQTQVVTGSFNFTYAAQQKNAENVLIIDDQKLAKKYLANWQRREQISQLYKGKVYSTSDEQADWLATLWEWLLKLIERLLRS